jgi:hypothetical protein
MGEKRGLKARRQAQGGQRLGWRGKGRSVLLRIDDREWFLRSAVDDMRAEQPYQHQQCRSDPRNNTAKNHSSTPRIRIRPSRRGSQQLGKSRRRLQSPAAGFARRAISERFAAPRFAARAG